MKPNISSEKDLVYHAALLGCDIGINVLQLFLENKKLDFSLAEVVAEARQSAKEYIEVNYYKGERNND
ncbi:hypothetical protein D6827_03440 [Candidatus Parcubacteria bacterium]|nr:MAG: hypothetical protein D6827_03440 [Candidatus Parcubacteria bacterium]